MPGAVTTPHLLPKLPAFPLKLPLLTFSPSSPFFFPNSPRKTISHPRFCGTSFALSSPSNGRAGFSVSASNNRRAGDGSDSEEEEEKGEEKSMLIMPFEEMERWFENKPSGFGEGKIYDTSIENKIVEEMEQSRRAQLANINKLKHGHQKIAAMKKKELEGQKAIEAVQSGIEVRVCNLPKKKNIHRDLHLAFKDFPSILHISPAVSGNKKTRDPICKGFAFLYLESEKAAQSFVQEYSGQSLQFGKIQKQITCEITNLKKSSAEQSAVGTHVSAPQLKITDMREKDAMIRKLREETDEDSDMDGLNWDLEKEMFSKQSEIATDGSGEMSAEQLVVSTRVSASQLKITDIREEKDAVTKKMREEMDEDSDMDSLNWDSEKGMFEEWSAMAIDSSGEMSTDFMYTMDDEPMFSNDDVIELGNEDINILDPNGKVEVMPTNEGGKTTKNRVARKPQMVKGKLDKDSRFNVRGAAKRLKIKEKAVLAGVFSKYGVNTSSGKS